MPFFLRCLHLPYNIIHILKRQWRLIVIVLVLMALEVQYHTHQFIVHRPLTNNDPPFHTGCRSPVLNTSARASAALVMLAKNSEVEGAVSSVKSVQEQFNAHFGYPWVFLNDENWTDYFIEMVRAAVGNASEVSFETIGSDMWGFPGWIDKQKARKRMDSMERSGILYAGKESYHHMCRFQSG